MFQELLYTNYTPTLGSTHPLWRGFFVMESNPVAVFLYLLTAIASLKAILFTIPWQLPARPLRLLLTGCLYGTYIVQTIGIFVGSKFFQLILQAPIPRTQFTSLFEWGLPFAFIAMLCLQLSEGVNRLLPWITDRTTTLPPWKPTVKFMNRLGHFYITAKACPGGLLCIPYFFYGILAIIYYAYKTLKMASSEIQPSRETRQIVDLFIFAYFMGLTLCSTCLLFLAEFRPLWQLCLVLISNSLATLTLLGIRWKKLFDHTRAQNVKGNIELHAGQPDLIVSTQ